MLWIVLMTVMIALTIAAVIYIVRGCHRFRWVRRIGERSKALSWLAAALIPASTILFCLINLWTFMVVFLHLALFWILCSVVVRLIERNRGKRSESCPEGAIAIALCVIYLCYGWFCAHHVFTTSYQLQTDKDTGGSLRIVLIADAHLGITLDGEGFAREMEKVQALSPDVVVFAGDYVDDDSSRADMLRASQALGELETSYGVYWVDGNHDPGYSNYRGFTHGELLEALEESGVHVLMDEAVLVGERFYIIGRKDRSEEQRGRGRAGIDALTAGLNDGYYQIVLDHQPNDYAAEAASGADLVLSGHTHGGHIFPAGIIGRLIGANDWTYGLTQREGTKFIVTSGISGWAIPFKTGTFSEIVVIDIGR